MRKNRFLLSLFLSCAFVFPFFLMSDNADVDIALSLSKKLNEMKFYDYSLYLLAKTMEENPAEADKIKIQIGLTNFAQGKIEDGEKLINTIASSSIYYLDSRRVMGLEAMKRGKYDIGIVALEEYFKVKRLNPPQDDNGKADYLEAWQYLIAAYQQKRDLKKVDEVLKYKEDILEKDNKKVSPLGDREGGLLSIQLKLDSLEQMKIEGKAGWQTTANDLIKALDELKWAGVDSITVTAGVEQARVYYLLDRYDDAIKTLTSPKNVEGINAFDDAYKEKKMSSNAPSVLAAYIEGLVYRAQGDKATSDEEKIKLYSKGLGKFYWIVLHHTAFPKFEKLLSGFSDCKDKLEKLGKVVKIPKEVLAKLNATISFKKKEADRLFKDAKFSQAIPIYLEEIRKSRRGEQCADNLSMLSYCYLKVDKPLEAMAVAWYLGEYFPKYSKTPGALLQVGEYLWSKSEFNDAHVLYRYYLKSCPTDQYAGAISARVAKLFYDRAAEAIKTARGLPPGPDKLAKNLDARQAFVDAVPYYQNIIDNFQHTDYGRSAFYLMGLCYYNARDYLKASDAFLKFCDKESKMPKDKIQLGDIADSKLRAAESCLQFAKDKGKEIKALKDKLALFGVVPSAPVVEAAKQVPEAGAAEEDASAESVPANLDAAESKEMNVEQMKKSMEEAGVLAKKYYLEAIKIGEEFVKMTEEGAILHGDSSKKTVAAKENIYALFGWAYDGMDDKENAIKALRKFITLYPEGKQTPVVMQRLGIIYGEQGKFADAAKVLEELGNKFPNSREGKQAKPTLAKSMYEIGNYAKSVEVFKELIDQKAEVSIFDLRWVLDNFSDCGGTHPKNASELALVVGKMLLEKLEKPIIEDWLGKTRASQIASDEKAQKSIMNILRDKISYDCGEAAYYAEDPQEAVKYLSTLLTNDNSSYYYDAKFFRALAYRMQKDYPKAISDYADISLRSNMTRLFSAYYRAQCMIGDVYLEQNEFKKALSSFGMMAAMDVDSWRNDDKTKALPMEESLEQAKWMEYAVYKAALCNQKLGDNDEKNKMVEKYKKFFPTGKFKSEVEKL